MDIQKAVNLIIAIAEDDSHGYDQTNRNSPDYDCSSLVATVLNEAGFPVKVDSWTGNLKSQLTACGFKPCQKPWKAGDIHLNEKYHVCMSVNETQIAQASMNEKGGITGGKPGDQTGKEIWVTGYYEYSKGWDCHLRYSGSNINKDVTKAAQEVIAGRWGNYPERKTLLENAGYNYEEVQQRVNELLENVTRARDLTEIALQVIDGKYGNYPERAKNIESLGYSYEEVQAKVNEILGV